jgi:acetyl esterase
VAPTSKTAPRLFGDADAFHLRGLRTVRSVMASSRGRFDRGAPAMETRDLAIPTPAGPLKARFYRPAAAAAAGPGLVFFHGGGFVICDIETHDALCRRLADAAGVRILSVDYRLAPEAPFPAQLDDAETALRWTIAEAASLQIDPTRLLAGGDSAGGYMTLAVAAKLNAERTGAVAGQLLIYPLLALDDVAWAASLSTHSRIVGRVTLGYIRHQLHLDAVPGSLAEADLAPLPPTLIAVGGHLDPCRPEGRRLAERLRAAGMPLTLLEYPRLPHGFASLTHLSVASRRAVAEIGGQLGELAAKPTAVRSAPDAQPTAPRARAARTG